MNHLYDGISLMGNVHTVLQTSPRLVYRGAVVRVRTAQRDLFDEAFRVSPIPSYLSVHRAHLSYHVPGVNIDGSMFYSDEFVLYLVIQPGGKWGYGEDMIEKIKGLGHMLDDATWFIDDEYRGYVQRWQLRGGVLDVEVVSEADDDVDAYVLRECQELEPEARGSILMYRALDALEYFNGEPDEYAQLCAELEEALTLHAEPNLVRCELARAYNLGAEPVRVIELLSSVYDQFDAAKLAYGEPRRVMAETIDQLGIAHLALGDAAEALECFLCTKDLYGQRASNAMLRCRALVALGDFQGARVAATSAISTQTCQELAESYLQFAVLEALAGQPDAALRHAKQYLDSAQSAYQAKKRRERLRQHHAFVELLRDDPRFADLR